MSPRTSKVTARPPGEVLPLAKALTRRTQHLCVGLDEGIAELYDRVTPATAELLRWWFGAEACQARGVNFHIGQRQAILNTIVAHEVLGCTDLAHLYREVCADALLEDDRLVEVSRPHHAHPKYCLKMATGTGKTWVLQALMVWQLLNRSAAQDEGRDDPRFTRRFLLVAPGLIVYERLLDAFLGKQREDGQRDFASADLAAQAELFLPPACREQVHQFVRGNTCAKNEIGLKATGNGLVAITNWHLLSEAGDEEEELDTDDAVLTPGTAPAAEIVARRALPVAPGRAAGNSLEMLDRRWARGNVLAFLSGLPDLMVFNDEAHHIHELKKAGEASEVEWQKSLNRLAEGKGRRFVQVDFSATPYNDLGTAKKKTKAWFPHIIVDFDLKAAMRAGLVKSLVLDRRKAITDALPLEFKAERDADGNVVLSDGQKVMLRAGLQKLRRLEADFAKVDAGRKPKMMVVCEDTTITPLVAEFLQDEGLHADDVLTVDSGKKAELGEKEWVPLRQRLFDVDRHEQPRVIVSVLMLREGFDVNNICVIVPLRASQAQILLEQTIGRGLRLMWRDPEFADLKRENRDRINAGEEPGSLIDILSIVEHPAFQSFYDDLIAEGLPIGQTGDDDEGGTAGDLIAATLRAGFETYDIPVPFVLHEADEELRHATIDIAALPPFAAMGRKELAALVGKGETFVSKDLQSAALFGDYRVAGAVMGVNGYNELLSRLTRRIVQAQNAPLPGGNRIASHLPRPYLQTGGVELAGAVDDYIHEHLFAEPFEPLLDEGWRLLALQPVVDHLVKVFGLALHQAEARAPYGETEVRYRRLSEVGRIMVRESGSLAVSKCIYDRLGYPSRAGGLERAFIEWAQSDAAVQSFCRISENRHAFMRLRYLKADGVAAHYHPDFLVRTADAVYLAETKAQDQVDHPNVQRKLKAAVAWCERINALAPEYRDGRSWYYALLGEEIFQDWREKGARLSELLAFARVRPSPGREAQAALEFGA